MSSEPNRTEAAARATYEHERDPGYSEPEYDWPNIDSGYDRLDEEEDDPEWCRNTYRASARVALAAADAWDAANGYVRIRVDDERIVNALRHWIGHRFDDYEIARIARAVVAVLTEGNTDDA